jgi:hypothetical protein
MISTNWVEEIDQLQQRYKLNDDAMIGEFR